jgi:hypothetical protein
VKPEADFTCQTDVIDEAYSDLSWYLRHENAPEAALHEYKVTFDSILTNIRSATAIETRAAYAARQAANDEKLKEAGVRLVEAMRSLRRYGGGLPS